MKIKVIGIGGIGCTLLPVLTRYLNFAYPDSEVVLIDGDRYEEKNAQRQEFQDLGDKAEMAATRFKLQFGRLYFSFKNEYVTQSNVYELIREGDIVFMCVDNHATRNLVSERCEELSDTVLISGGNDYTDGNVQVYVRKDGEDITLPIANDFHPEIQYPEDENPAEASCDQLINSEPQLLITNNAIAATMISLFYSYLQGKLDCDEVYVDILTGNSRAVNRRKSSVCQ